MKEIEQKDEIILIVKDAINANARMGDDDVIKCLFQSGLKVVISRRL